MFERLHNISTPILKLSLKQEKALSAFRNKIEQGEYLFEDRPCLCGDTGGYLIAKRDRYALNVNTWLCRKCGLMRTSPQLTNESLKKFYEDDYRAIYVGDEKASDEFFKEQVFRGASVFSFIKSNIDFKSTLKVFDIGCGAGGILVPFRDAGFTTFGCDLGRKYLEFGKAQGLALVHGEAASLTEHAPADLVLLNHVLEHIKDPLGFLKSIRGLLSDYGYLYIEVPGILNVHNAYKGDLLMFLQNAHLYHFTLGTLIPLLSEAGFELVKGDQLLRAIFKKKEKIHKSSKNEYHKVLLYLYYLEVSRKLKGCLKGQRPR